MRKVVLQVRVGAEVIEELDRRAGEGGETRSEVARRMIEEGVGRKEETKEVGEKGAGVGSGKKVVVKKKKGEKEGGEEWFDAKRCAVEIEEKLREVGGSWACAAGERPTLAGGAPGGGELPAVAKGWPKAGSGEVMPLVGGGLSSLVGESGRFEGDVFKTVPGSENSGGEEPDLAGMSGEDIAEWAEEHPGAARKYEVWKK